MKYFNSLRQWSCGALAPALVLMILGMVLWGNTARGATMLRARQIFREGPNSGNS